MVHCWCGNTTLIPFSRAYLKCNVCETIVADSMPGPGILRPDDDKQDFYGRDYWFSHQKNDLGHPDIETRSRTDLPERCLHWLRSLIKYKTPPAKVLEIGSAHGGFVALLRWAGFDACGLELSPWVVNFARRMFSVPMLLGPIEDQAVEPNSLDVIALMDVLEHLPDPMGTMRCCLNMLSPTGLFIIQTPRYSEGETYSIMVERDDPFLKQLKERDHVYLFSQQSIRELFRRLGVDHLVFEPAIFSQYDMFLLVSRAPLVTNTQGNIEKCLSFTPSGRMVQALIDLDSENDSLKENLVESESDRVARLEVIERQAREFGERMAEVEADRAARLEVIERQAREFGERIAELESDRAARLEVIERQAREFGERIAELESDRAARLEVIERQAREFEKRMAEVEADRAARLEVIERQAREFGERMAEVEADRAARLEVINEQGRRLGELEAERNVLDAQLHSLRQQFELVEADRQRMKLSLSWKITAPFRWLLNRWNSIFQKFWFITFR